MCTRTSSSYTDLFLCCWKCVTLSFWDLLLTNIRVRLAQMSSASYATVEYYEFNASKAWIFTFLFRVNFVYKFSLLWRIKPFYCTTDTHERCRTALNWHSWALSDSSPPTLMSTIGQLSTDTHERYRTALHRHSWALSDSSPPTLMSAIAQLSTDTHECYRTALYRHSLALSDSSQPTLMSAIAQLSTDTHERYRTALYWH